MAPAPLKLTGRLSHGGRLYEPGQPVPDGVDLDRLKRLGLVKGQAPAKQ